MNFSKQTIDQVDLRNKRVLIRVDFNVPLDETYHITDDSRIRAALPTINWAMDDNAVVILCSHLGRPNGTTNPALSLAPVAKRLQRLLNKPVAFTHDCIGPAAESVVKEAQPGDVVLLENLRFHPGEEKNDDQFSAQLAGLADVYINEAFGTAHRSHSSTVGITKYMKVSAAGFLMKREVETLERTVENPVRPFVAILGGAKVSGKIEVIKNLTGKVDKVIIGGGMAFTFIKAMGFEIGKSLVEENMLDLAKHIHDQAIAQKIKFYLPVDCVVAANLEPHAETMIVPIQEIPPGW